MDILGQGSAVCIADLGSIPGLYPLDTWSNFFYLYLLVGTIKNVSWGTESQPPSLPLMQVKLDCWGVQVVSVGFAG